MGSSADRGRAAARGGLLALAAALLFVLARGGGEPSRPAASARDGRAGAPAGAPAPGAGGTPAGESEVERLARGPLPRSLRGTEVGGGLTLGEDGHFVPTPDAIALFDYFLAASGEEPEAVLRQRIVDRIRATLPAPAAAEAEALLDTYLRFRAALRELAEAGDAPADLERRLQWVRELRREHFGATAETLFGEEEETIRIDLERRRVAADPALDETEKRARLEALDERLPESVRAARERARAPSATQQEVEALREAGASEQEVFALREERFGREAAERLAALDVEQQRWQDRLAAYRAERDALVTELEASGAGPAARDDAIEALRQRRFSEAELLRVRALDGAGP